MAIDDTDGGESEETRSSSDRLLQNVNEEAGAGYSWSDFRREHHDGGRFDRSKYLGFDPQRTDDYLEDGASAGKTLDQYWQSFLDLETTPVVKGSYRLEHFKREYYYEEGDRAPRDGDGNKIPFELEEYLGFGEDEVEGELSLAEDRASTLKHLVDERTVDVNEELDEDAFFSTVEGHTTVVNRYDLEKTVPLEKKKHFYEVERYWVNKPYACVIIFHSRKENERKYYVVEPYLNEIEVNLQDFLARKLRTAIKYSDDDIVVDGSEADRADVIQRETEQLLQRYDLYSEPVKNGSGTVGTIKGLLGMGSDVEEVSGELEGILTRPEPAVLAEDSKTLTEYQVEKLLYKLKRNFIGYQKIDPIKHDINVEDVSCDGYNSRVFVYHTEYENIISNVEHGKSTLDDFVVKLAQRSGKGISKRQPQVDATLPDGSRAQLTLGDEVSDHGTNYTIRQFKDVPFTPIDLINWNTFSLDQMAFLWLCIENHKSLIFAGGTASGKTTSLNAVSLFIPSNSKIVSIEDTREVELPQRNWVASVTRPSFGEDDKGDVDEFDLLEAALRQRPDYIVMGEIRGEEGRTLFQVMSTGHTTYTTFHADSVGEVIKRFTTDPINVSKTLFTALDLVSIQTQTRTDGKKVRRSKSLTEINEYTPENDEINVRDVYQWQADTDQFIQMGNSNTLEEIKFDRGWGQDRLDEELFKRKVVLAYLIENGLNTYTQVAATIQAFINDPDTIMTLIANDQLERSLEDLREMESVEIEVDQEKEELVPRPDPGEDMREEAQEILDNADPLFRQLRASETSDIVSALTGIESEEDITPVPADEEEDSQEETVEFGQFVPKAGAEATDDG
ncbi:type II/IV secretion system ATPase subunit [Halapricum salinum]|uniref:Secretion system protein n=1 Tax=Halapricum salinum TaxID=1457250 RepID=A0A4D6HB57_9EURY|nr:type II/IV secretion system ATPase subunit [Halapricum salinum]QCC49997.1 secretion system protein [Halapricum salinum]